MLFEGKLSTISCGLWASPAQVFPEACGFSFIFASKCVELRTVFFREKLCTAGNAQEKGKNVEKRDAKKGLSGFLTDSPLLCGFSGGKRAASSGWVTAVIVAFGSSPACALWLRMGTLGALPGKRNSRASAPFRFQTFRPPSSATGGGGIQSPKPPAWGPVPRPLLRFALMARCSQKIGITPPPAAR